MKKSNHGGKRANSGRKPRATPRSALSLKLEPEVMTKWSARKTAEGISGPELLKKLLAK